MSEQGAATVRTFRGLGRRRAARGVASFRVRTRGVMVANTSAHPHFFSRTAHRARLRTLSPPFYLLLFFCCLFSLFAAQDVRSRTHHSSPLSPPPPSCRVLGMSKRKAVKQEGEEGEVVEEELTDEILREDISKKDLKDNATCARCDIDIEIALGGTAPRGRKSYHDADCPMCDIAGVEGDKELRVNLLKVRARMEKEMNERKNFSVMAWYQQHETQLEIAIKESRAELREEQKNLMRTSSVYEAPKPYALDWSNGTQTLTISWGGIATQITETGVIFQYIHDESKVTGRDGITTKFDQNHYIQQEVEEDEEETA